MRPSVETKFKNSNLKLIEAFGRTGGMHHPCSSPTAMKPRSIRRIRAFVRRFLAPHSPYSSHVPDQQPILAREAHRSSH